VPEWLNGAVSKTVVGLKPTVGSNPTLSAGRKILVAAKAAHYRQPQSFGDMVLTDRGLTTEIAQFQLGDLTFNVRYSHFTCSAVFVKKLWDIGNWISTLVLICPVSASMSRLFPCVTKSSIQKRLFSSSRKSPIIEKSDS
jgi:hypothetical protein